MAFFVAMIALGAFLFGAVISVFIVLVVGIHIGDHARHLADEPGARLDALTRGVLGVGVRTTRTAGDRDGDES